MCVWFSYVGWYALTLVLFIMLRRAFPSIHRRIPFASVAISSDIGAYYEAMDEILSE